jgi:hypothetical protein
MWLSQLRLYVAILFIWEGSCTVLSHSLTSCFIIDISFRILRSSLSFRSRNTFQIRVDTAFPLHTFIPNFYWLSRTSYYSLFCLSPLCIKYLHVTVLLLCLLPASRIRSKFAGNCVGFWGFQRIVTRNQPAGYFMSFRHHTCVINYSMFIILQFSSGFNRKYVVDEH